MNLYGVLLWVCRILLGIAMVAVPFTMLYLWAICAI